MQPIVRKFLGGYIIIFKTWITLRIYLLEVLALLEAILPRGGCIMSSLQLKFQFVPKKTKT